jgi:hypothetical protein
MSPESVARFRDKDMSKGKTKAQAANLKDRDKL